MSLKILGSISLDIKCQPSYDMDMVYIQGGIKLRSFLLSFEIKLRKALQLLELYTIIWSNLF